MHSGGAGARDEDSPLVVGRGAAVDHVGRGGRGGRVGDDVGGRVGRGGRVGDVGGDPRSTRKADRKAEQLSISPLVGGGESLWDGGRAGRYSCDSDFRQTQYALGDLLGSRLGRIFSLYTSV